jgi:hypothetical protein
MRYALILSAVIAAASFSAAAEPKDVSKPTIEVMLNKLSADKHHIGALTPALVVTPTRFLMVEDENRFYQVALDGIRPVDGVRGLSAFEYAPDGSFVGVRGKDLVSLAKNGKLEKIMTLPSAGMGLAAGRGKMYLFERAGSERSGIFILLPDKKGLKLFESPEPIAAVMEDGDGILFAAGSAIYRFSADKKTKLVLGLPKGSRNITSLAQDPKTQRIYASDGASVFSFKDKDVVVITRENGGILRWFGDGLIIFDPKAPLLIRIRGMPF